VTIESDREKQIQFSQKHGEFVVVEDGFTVFWPRKTNRYLASRDLRWIADELDKRNAPTYTSLNEYFNASKDEPVSNHFPRYFVQHCYHDMDWQLLKKFDSKQEALSYAKEQCKDSICVGMTRVVDTYTGDVLATNPAGGNRDD
jgi:hypothetical protein